MMRFASSSVAHEVDALVPLSEISQREYSPQHHVILDEEVEQLVKTLAEKGYSPRVEEL